MRTPAPRLLSVCFGCDWLEASSLSAQNAFQVSPPGASYLVCACVCVCVCVCVCARIRMDARIGHAFLVRAISPEGV